MTIRQHIPNYVDGVESQVAEFQTRDELLAVPWIRRYAETDAFDFNLRERVRIGMGSFYRWSLTRDGMLMAEYDQGLKWWVVA